MSRPTPFDFVVASLLLLSLAACHEEKSKPPAMPVADLSGIPVPLSPKVSSFEAVAQAAKPAISATRKGSALEVEVVGVPHCKKEAVDIEATRVELGVDVVLKPAQGAPTGGGCESGQSGRLKLTMDTRPGNYNAKHVTLRYGDRNQPPVAGPVEVTVQK